MVPGQSRSSAHLRFQRGPNGATNGAQRRSDAALQLDRQLRGVETVSVPRHF